MENQSYITWRDARIQELLSQEKYDFDDLCDVVIILRGEGGCPWDREQDHHSIRTGLIEECYEVIEAIDNDDPVLLREELGDLLLQIVFHADMEKDIGRFSIQDVANDECVKMIHRHPHVFGQIHADTSEQVLENWEMIKKQEKHRESLSDQLEAIPPILPALMRAQKVGKKAGIDSDLSEDEIIDKLIVQLASLKHCHPPQGQKEALGEILFDMTTLTRKKQLDAEEALTACVEQKIKQAKTKS